MKLDPFVAQIMMISNINHFTTSDIRTAYLTLKNDSSLDPVSTRRFIYSELIKLEKKGWLRKVISKKKELTSFIKTEQMDLKQLNSIAKPKNDGKAPSHNIDILKSKLTRYKDDLLVGIGESEAYKELSDSNPEFISDIQQDYNLIREKNTKLLGKIKGIEKLIKVKLSKKAV